jgi:cell fate regulator YaaT (PSP1 superfamily)
MGCTSCSSGRGGLPAGCKNNGACGVGGCDKLPVFDWLANMELPDGKAPFDIVEVRFKNSRKEFFKIGDVSGLAVGDAIAVEASPGHDIGMVSMTGELVRLQLKKLGMPVDGLFKAVYRKARPADLEKWEVAVEREQATMMRARAIAVELKLNMKISDVEYQGDSSKAIFYYTAEDRVDFRELIRHLADEFKIRVEMKQIGSRQESARLGGIGSCGRELCCSTWLRDFRSVNTSAARYQQLSLNPQKLAGQCGKLKCCLNYELDSYLDALKDFPEGTPRLETKKAGAFHQKTDIFKRVMYYAYVDDPGNFIAVPISRVKLIMELNKNGEKPDVLLSEKEIPKVVKELDYDNVVGQDSLTRFDSEKRKKKKKKKKPGSGTGAPSEGVVSAAATEALAEPQQRPQRPPQQNRPQGQRPPQAERAPQGERPQQQPNQQNRPTQPANQGQRPNSKRPNNGPRPPKPQQPPQPPEA